MISHSGNVAGSGLPSTPSECCAVAAKPIERYVKKQIADQGGWPRILERIASGQTRTAISHTLLRPDGKAIDRSTFSHMLHRWTRLAPQNETALRQADAEAADAHAEASIQIMHDAPLDRDAIQKARLEADSNLRYAGLINREKWGERKQEVNVQVNVADIHLDSLRHRMIEASRPLAAALHQVLPFPQSSQTLATGTVGGEHGVQACDTVGASNGNGVVTVPPQAGASD